MKNRIVIAALLLPTLALSVFSSPVNNSISVETAYETAYTDNVEIRDFANLSEVLSISISTAEQFNDFAAKVNSGAEGYSTAVCTLSGNIDFDGATLTPIGTSSHPFSGIFDGKGYKICNYVTKKTNFCGVVGYMRDGNIRNLAVENGTIDFDHTISVSAGLICGYAENSVSGTSGIENCSASGKIDVSCTGASLNIGGLVGKIVSNKGSFNVNNCFSEVDIAVATSNSCYVGGFAGHISAMSSAVFTLRNCYSNSKIEYSAGAAHMYAGGLTGYINQDESGWSGWYSDEIVPAAEVKGNLVYCFADTDVICNGVSKDNAGALSGYKGENIVIVKCYYSSEAIINGAAINKLGTAVSSSEFINKDFLADTLNYDMVNVWYLNESDYPYLRALCPSNGAPVTVNGASIRVSDPCGMRFMASANSLMRSYSAEYGFIVALKSKVGNNELTFDSNIKYVSGAAFVSDEENTIDKVYELTEDGVNFTGVLVNIPSSQYKTVFIARPYVKFVSNGETVTMYGNPVERSPYQVALAISQSDEYNNLTDDEKLVIDSMIVD